jgi:hypothetical protein
MNDNNDVLTSLAGTATGAIEQRAYQIWEAAGRPENRDLEFWLTAEADLRSRSPLKDSRVVRRAPASTRTAAQSAPSIASGVRLPVTNRKVASIAWGQKKTKQF